MGGVRLARLIGRRACCFGLVGLAAIVPFFTGAQSQFAWSVMGIAALALAAVALATTLRRPRRHIRQAQCRRPERVEGRRLPAPWLLIALSILALLLLIQLVPLPISVVGALSPRRAELARQADAALGREPPGVVALTVSTKTTRDALCLLAVYVSVFLASGLLFRGPRRMRLLFMALGVSGACMALWGVLGVLAGKGLPLTSTYTNRNRLAALLVMELFAAVGWAMFTFRRGPLPDRQVRKWERTAAVSCAGAIALGIVMTLSRLGLASVAVSLVLLAFLAFRSELPVLGNTGSGVGPPEDRGDRRRVRVLVAGASLTVSAILASLLTSLDPVLARYSLLFEAGVGRLTGWRTSLGIVRDFPLAGSGAGSFRHVFPLYQRAGELEGFWKYAHNDVLNALTDLGPVGLCLVLGAVFFWYRSAWRGFGTASVFRRTVAWIGVGAVTAALVHSLADFVLKQPANALVFSVLAGAVAGGGRASRRAAPDRPTGSAGASPSRTLRGPLFAALAVVPIAFAVLLVPIARAGYWKARAEETEEPDQRAEALTNALRHDPRDGETRHAAAQLLARAIPEGDAGAAPEPLKATAEAVIAILRGAPPGETMDARALYLAGAMLWRTGEARRADIAMRTAAEFASAYDDVTFRVGVYFLRRWIETRGRLRLGDAGALDLSVEFFRRACLSFPGGLKRAFDLLSVDPQSASRMREIVPPDPRSQLRAARYLRRLGRVREARGILEGTLAGLEDETRGAERARVLELLTSLRDETGDPEGALRARLDHVTATPIESRSAAASAHVDGLLREKRPADADLFVRALRRRFPAEPAGLYAEARYAAASGDHLLAYRALLQYVEHAVDAEGFHRLAAAARRLNRFAEAEKYAGRAISLRPGAVCYLLARGSLREARGETEGATTDLRAALGLRPADARLRRRLASVYLGAGRPLHAVEVWRDAISRSPRDASAHVELARAYRAAGFHEEAARHARRALELDPKRPSVLDAARDLLRSIAPDG